MSLSRKHFQHLIPHAGAMCLIDRVVEWNEKTIRCSSATHRCADAAGLIYEVTVAAGAKPVLAGRLMIVLNSRVFR